MQVATERGEWMVWVVVFAELARLGLVLGDVCGGTLRREVHA